MTRKIKRVPTTAVLFVTMRDLKRAFRRIIACALSVIAERHILGRVLRIQPLAPERHEIAINETMCDFPRLCLSPCFNSNESMNMWMPSRRYAPANFHSAEDTEKPSIL